MAKDRPFAFAGLWETWHGNDGSGLDSCTIVTTDANNLMRLLHDRMPVILPEENFAQWLDSKNENVPELEALLRPFSADEMTAFPISTTARGTNALNAFCRLPLPPDSSP